MVQFVKLRLSGFKSFVDPTELLIEPGMTGVVGPNGCGKSNLVEALRWVMGETSAKRMRGSGMDDVIFNGSATRPQRNLGEVSIALDNRKRLAPAAFNDYDDLEVTRRIEREKGSTYKVNGKEVRARDVQLLFADAATGANSTAIVSQGRIGTIINAKPAQRRMLLEEAAGITGLHSRRHEAELRLRAAETNLERLDDVITTLEDQLQGLKKQARQANRYRNIADQLRRQEALLLHLDAQDIKSRQSEVKGKLAEAEALVAEKTRLAAHAASAQAEAASQLPDLRNAEAEAAAALQRLLLTREGLEREEQQARQAGELAEQRLRQLDGDLVRAAGLAQDAQEAEDRLSQERQGLEAAAAGEKEEQAQAQKERESLFKAATACEERMSLLTQEVSQAEALERELARRVQDLEQRLARLTLQSERLTREQADLNDTSEDQAMLENLSTDLSEKEVEAEDLREAADQADAQLADLREQLNSAQEQHRRNETDQAKLEAEVSALSALLSSVDGGDWEPLLNSVSVDSGFEQALGAALGEDINAPADESAPLFWRPLTPYTTPPALPDGVTPLSELVRGPDELTRRLSQIGLLDDEERAANLQDALLPGQCLISRDGALWRWDGFSARADAPSSAAQRLAQKNRLAELEEQLRPKEAKTRESGEVMQRLRDQLQTAGDQEKHNRQALRTLFGDLDRLRGQKTRLVEKLAAAQSRQKSLLESQQANREELNEVDRSLSDARKEQADLPDLENQRQGINSLRVELAERRAALSEAEGQLHRLAREREARSQRLLAIEQERASWQRRAQEAGKHQADLQARQKEISEELSSLSGKPEAIRAQRDALADGIGEAESKRKRAADRLAQGEVAQAEVDRELKAAEMVLAQAREERVRAESTVAQANQAMTNLIERVQEKLDCAVAKLLEVAGLKEGVPLPPRPDVERKLGRLQGERERMGAVNLRAEAESEELETRIAGMLHEREDLTEAIARLRQGIANLNREGRQRLLEAFEQVNNHFIDLFTRLFGGGQAHLALTESEDPLDAGLEIMASPPGKRLQIMSLLSGGEQALTALALLFAVFLTNPAPICVLDEVDAPLDDSNVDRFCSLVEELAHSLETRFLVITHHRLTMARVDRLFGVTMGERGVSQLVSVDLEGAERFRESA
ncbi:AAA family ATPase [Rhodovibrionaceae bacterium A322]